MAIPIHPADALVHRLLQQNSAPNSRVEHRSRAGNVNQPEDKVSISTQARDVADSKSASRLESRLLKMYGPSGG
ncbi:MAG: hypothetical protein ACE5DY_06055 [Mariprofundaceae bacterium]